MHNQSGEDYLEAILVLSGEIEFVHQIDVARKMNVSQPAVQKALKILKSKGFIETDGLHIYLTQRGREYADDIYHKHLTIAKFLQLHGVNSADAEADACKLEHAVSQATFAMMEKYVSENAE